MAQQQILPSHNLVLNEAFDSKSNEFLYTSFALINSNDVFYFGKLPLRQSELTSEQCMSALCRVPDEEICPRMPSIPEQFLTFTPMPNSPDLYVKRPGVGRYIEYKELDCVSILPALLLDEAQALQRIRQYPPHPNIVQFHGCCVRRSFITGLVFDKYQFNLEQYVQLEKRSVDKKCFMAALLSAVQHLHSIGMAHNDINPTNIMVDESGMPVLVDFDSCKELGRPLTFSQGTPGWMDENADYTFSEASHDLYGVDKVRDWLDERLECPEV